MPDCLTGYADSKTGTAEYNKRNSLKSVLEAVVNELVKMGVKP